MLQTVSTTRMAGNFDGVKTPIWAPLSLIQGSVQIVGTQWEQDPMEYRLHRPLYTFPGGGGGVKI